MLYYQIILLICSSFLLPKSILSPKCISPIPQSLSPEVNLCLYPHSAETETHIYFIPKMAKSFDLLCFSRQKADCFHMLCHWKQVHSHHLFNLISPLFKHPEVTRKRVRTAGNIDDFLRCQLRDAA